MPNARDTGSAAAPRACWPPLPCCRRKSKWEVNTNCRGRRRTRAGCALYCGCCRRSNRSFVRGCSCLHPPCACLFAHLPAQRGPAAPAALATWRQRCCPACRGRVDGAACQVRLARLASGARWTGACGLGREGVALRARGQRAASRQAQQGRAGQGRVRAAHYHRPTHGCSRPSSGQAPCPPDEVAAACAARQRRQRPGGSASAHGSRRCLAPPKRLHSERRSGRPYSSEPAAKALPPPRRALWAHGSCSDRLSRDRVRPI